jgi:hypothetical protein
MPLSAMSFSAWSRSFFVSASSNAVSGTSYPSLRPAQLGDVRGVTPAARTKSVQACRWSPISPLVALVTLIAHCRIASARSFETWVVVQTRGFHSSVSGTKYVRLIANVLPSISSLTASPSKSSVHTT